MKRKLLLAALCVVGALGMRAQEDVTSTYIKNADFEGSHEAQDYPNGSSNPDRAIYKPADWTVSWSGNQYDMSTLKSGDLGFNNFSGLTIPSSGYGDKTYRVRFRYKNTGSLTLKQSVTLPKGTYTLGAYTTGINQIHFQLFAGNTKGQDSNKGANSFGLQSVDFTVDNSEALDLGILIYSSTSTDINLGAVDNFTLSYKENYTTGLANVIAYANQVNTSLNNAALSTAITTAQSVINNKTDQLAYQSTIDEAITTLNTAISTAVQSDLSDGDVTYLLKNPSFENGQTWYIKTQGGDSYYATDWTNSSAFTSSSWSYSVVSTDKKSKDEKSYKIRFNWANTTYSVSQTIGATLPAGRYTITADVQAVSDNGSTEYAYVQGNNTQGSTITVSTSTFNTPSAIVDLNEPGTLNVVLGMDYRFDTRSDGEKSAQGIYYWDNVTLTYASAANAYSAAQSSADSYLNNGDYTNVTGTERSSLSKAAHPETAPSTVEEYFTATAAIETAIADFIAAKSAYDACVAAKAITVPDLTYAAAAKKTALQSAIDATVNTAEEATTNTSTITTALRAYYESHAMAEGVEGAVNCADLIAGADPDTNTGWTGGIGVDNRSQEKYTDASGNPSGKYYDGGWSASAGVNIDMSRSISLPAGKYLLTVTARGSENLTSYQMSVSVADSPVNLPKNGSGENTGVFGHGWDDVSLEFETEGDPVTLAITAQSTDYYQWISFNRFRLVRLELYTAKATAEDYAALNAAITAAEANTLGFENGEYAPYNNVAALTALANAKAVDQTVDNVKADIEALTTALTGATWTVNTEDVDAIFNGMFDSTVEGDWGLTGWTRTNGWGQQRTEIEGTYATAYYNQPGSLQYGNKGVYTMPLAANTWYKLTFAYRSHENNSNDGVKASVLCNGKGLPETSFEENNSTTDWKVVEQYFSTGAAGNYVLTLANSGNTWMTGVSLVKDAPQTITVTADPDFEGYKTFYNNTDVNYEAPEGTTVYIAAEPENGSVQLTKVVDNIVPARKAVILKTTIVNNANTDITLTKTESGSEADFTANKLQAAANNIVSNVYILACTNELSYGFYYFTGTLDAGDVYLTGAAPAAGAPARMIIVADGEATAINSVKAAEADKADGAIYNMAGQRVNGSYKGIVIKNGKKYMNK